MKNLRWVLLSTAIGLTFAASAQGADLPTKKDASAPVATSCFDSIYSYMSSSAKDCPLSWKGITLYGTIDIGAGYATHGSAFNSTNQNAVAELIAKMSSHGQYQFVPNGLGQSNIGVKVREEFAPNWAFIGDANLGFDPYSLQLANGPKSLSENDAKTIGNQNYNSDSSRAGQWDNSRAYLGVSNSTYGTLTFGRQNALTNDLVAAYDPMGGSYAFSLIGNSSSYVSGVGVTETARYNTSFEYKVAYNGFRASGLAQVGGYGAGNSADAAYQAGVGFDYSGLSFDAIYSYAQDAVALSTYSATPLPAGVTSDDLKATLADVNGVVLAAKYTYHQVTGFGGYEYARFSNPTDPHTGGFTGIEGYHVLPGGLTNNAFNNNKILQVAWGGLKYAVRPDLDLTGAYYYGWQNTYLATATTTGGAATVTACEANTTKSPFGGFLKGTNKGYCAGHIDAVSALIDWRPLKRLDVYAGIMYSEVTGGLASGFLNTNNLEPAAGLRLQF